MKNFISFLFFIISFSTFSQSENPFEDYKKKMVGQIAPDFKFKDLSGKEFYLSDLKGKVVLLNMWFINCHGCKIEFPGLQNLKRRLIAQKKDADIVLLSLALDSEESLKEHLKKNPLNFYNMAEAGDISQGTYHTLGFPTNIIVDKSGVIRHVKLGGSPQSADDLEYEMIQLLK
jgi:cytochrome oxidase Cu insertion factor (SCO1/SenC/PrrC family)